MRESECKRLTTDKKKIFVRECPTIMSVTKAELHKLYIEIFDRLQEYEVAEETGQIIVPPVKVGQTIYYHFQFRNKSILPFTRKAKVKEIYCSNNKMGFIVDAELIDAKEKGIMKSFDFDDFGKTAFTSREEAQKALEGSGEK